ncbi:MAG TPA: Npt1/Npt2 family nucleotide transporter [Bryobacteraceae bacterium]|nr:Npt1/Npt2 family nucleotide transporter [Bryobacteraceae bacterium]
MRTFRNLWRNIYDVRPGERLRALFMFLYLLLVLFSYYILKPVSQAMFLNRFDIDDLPILIILVAFAGGILAYLYSRAAMRTSLSNAVNWTMGVATASLVLIWWALGYGLPWMLYVFNIFVGLFSIVLVTQGWLVAGNVFDAREAKRIFPLLGMSLLIGAGFGGVFTRYTAALIGSRNLVLAAALLVVLAWSAFLMLRANRGLALQQARAAEAEEANFSVTDMVRDIVHSRHLQVIIAMMAMIFIVDTLVNFQFQAMAKERYQGDQLTVFLGSFYGLWLVAAEFIVQFLVTTTVVARFGVGGSLQIMPVAVMLASVATVAAPGVYTAAATRLTEAVTRYTLNKTGLELLYMPLPREMRNRIKAFIDIFFDRISRGIGAVMLILFTRVWDLTVRQIAMVVIGLTIPWMLVSLRARREYISTIRKRLASRRLDLENPRITLQERDTIRLLEETATAPNPRQATYALGLLADVRDYDIVQPLRKLANSPFPEVRAKVFELARAAGTNELLGHAEEEIRAAADGAAVKAAVVYAITVAPDGVGRARGYLNASDPKVAEGAIEALAGREDVAAELITHDWLSAAAADPDPERRTMAATAVGVRGDRGTEVLHRLLADPHPGVAAAACRAAAAVRNRAYVYAIFERIGDAHVRGAAIESLARYGPQICGTLADLLEDQTVPAAIRRHVPRVLKRIPDQRSVDVLLRAVAYRDLAIRGAVLKGLNHLRENSPGLKFEDRFVTAQIYAETRYYFELVATMAPLRGSVGTPHTATHLMVRSIEERLRQTLERLFRLLGLRYPPKEIYSTYLAVSRSRREEMSTAIEFLDTVLDRDIKKLLLPLLDAPEHLQERARDLFGLEFPDAEHAITDLIRSRDPWLSACAIASAAELQLRGLAPVIAEAAQQAEPDVTEVARSAREALHA